MASIKRHCLLDQATLDINDKSVVHIILDQPLHGCVDVLNADLLNLTGNVVLGAEIKHILRFLDTSDGAATNPETACRSCDNMQTQPREQLLFLGNHGKLTTATARVKKCKYINNRHSITQ